jgi:hypothetical protein
MAKAQNSLARLLFTWLMVCIMLYNFTKLSNHFSKKVYNILAIFHPFVSDPHLLSKTGKAHLSVDLAEEYGFKDIDGDVL